MKNESYLALGSNIGDRKCNLYKALRMISQNTFIHIADISSIYESEPMYFSSEYNFYNMVIQIYTDMKPLDLLSDLKMVEKRLGRTSSHNQSREIDIDILTYNRELINLKTLIVPHPHIKERKFVLGPWTELDKNYKLPHVNLSINEMLNNLDTNIMCNKIYETQIAELRDV